MRASTARQLAILTKALKTLARTRGEKHWIYVDSDGDVGCVAYSRRGFVEAGPERVQFIVAVKPKRARLQPVL